jgi:hypothetical protein
MDPANKFGMFPPMTACISLPAMLHLRGCTSFFMISTLRIVLAMWQLFRQAIVYNRREAKAAVSEINAALQEKGFEALSVQEAKRVGYYTLQSSITALWFGTLHGRQLNEQERKAKRFAGSFTVFQDDLTDNPDYHYQSFMDLVEAPEQKVLHHREEWMAWYCYQTMLQAAPDASLVRRTAVLAEQGQHESRKQLQQNLGEEELQQISYHKGGAATLFYRSMMQPEISAAEEALIYACGELLQWNNDIFDVYKDHHAGVQTLFTSAYDLKPWKLVFIQKLESIKTQLRQLPMPAPGKKHFWHQYLSVACRGLVCFDQLIALQDTTGGIFNIAQYERQPTICDMEKWSNLRASIRYAASFARLE